MLGWRDGSGWVGGDRVLNHLLELKFCVFCANDFFLVYVMEKKGGEHGVVVGAAGVCEEVDGGEHHGGAGELEETARAKDAGGGLGAGGEGDGGEGEGAGEGADVGVEEEGLEDEETENAVGRRGGAGR